MGDQRSTSTAPRCVDNLGGANRASLQDSELEAAEVLASLRLGFGLGGVATTTFTTNLQHANVQNPHQQHSLEDNNRLDIRTTGGGLMPMSADSERACHQYPRQPDSIQHDNPLDTRVTRGGTTLAGTARAVENPNLQHASSPSAIVYDSHGFENRMTGGVGTREPVTTDLEKRHDQYRYERHGTAYYDGTLHTDTVVAPTNRQQQGALGGLQQQSSAPLSLKDQLLGNGGDKQILRKAIWVTSVKRCELGDRRCFATDVIQFLGRSEVGENLLKRQKKNGVVSEKAIIAELEDFVKQGWVHVDPNTKGHMVRPDIQEALNTIDLALEAPESAPYGYNY